MKNKFFLLIATFCTIATLSFSFVSEKDIDGRSQKLPAVANATEAPAGGFTLGDELEK